MHRLKYLKLHTLCGFWLETPEYFSSPHLPPVLKEVLPEDVLGGVLMIQHLGKKCSYFLSRRIKFHRLTCKCRKKITFSSRLDQKIYQNHY